MIAEDADGNATGALIVADGLTDARTYLCLQKAVMALVALEPGSIEIVGKDGGFGGAM